MKSLKEHDLERSRAWTEQSLPSGGAKQPNGIACPRCGEELVDTMPQVQLTSIPPRKHVGCLSCGWTGTRVA